MSTARAAEDPSYVGFMELLRVDDSRALRQSSDALVRARQAHDPRAEMLALRNNLSALPPSTVQPTDIQRGLELARQLGDEEARGRFLNLQAQASDDLDGDIALLEASIEIAQRLKLDRLLADDYLWMGITETSRGRTFAGVDWNQKAYALYESLQQPRLMADALDNMATSYRFPYGATTADLETATGLLRRALALVGNKDTQRAMYLTRLGWTQYRLGHFESAENLLRGGLAMYDGKPSDGSDLYYEANAFLGRFLVERHRPADALPFLATALSGCPAGTYPGMYIEIEMATARAHAQLGETRTALDLVAQVRPVMDKVKVSGLEADYHAAAAEIDAAVGDYRAANIELQQGIAAQNAAASGAQTQRLQELKVRFDVALKDRANALLKARAAEDANRRLQLSAAVLVLAGGALLLGMRLRSTRSANALLDELARRGREITSGLDAHAVLAALREQLHAMAGASAVAVWLVGDEDGLQRIADTPTHAPENIVSETIDDAGLAELVARCAREERELIGPATASRAASPAAVGERPAPSRFARGRGWRRRATTTQVLCEPLLDAGRVIGVAAIRFTDAPRARTRARQIVRTSCLYAAVALANIRTARLLGESRVALEQQRTRDALGQAETLRETNAGLEQLAAIGQEITRQLSESGVVQALERNIGGLVQDVALTVYRSVRDGGALVGLERAGHAASPQAPAWVDFDDAHSDIARCAREQRELPLESEARLSGQAAGRRAAQFMPLRAGDELLGVLVVEGASGVVFPERDQLMLRSLRAYASVGLANAIAYRGLESALGKLDVARHELEQKNALLETAYEQQREASLTDSLTRLHNRRFLNERIDDEVSITWRRHEPCGGAEPRMPDDGDLIFYIVDIDHFKAVNDQHGHGAGDRVLVQVAQRLRVVARESDYVVRWGGEEFMVVARATSAEHASELAERLRHAIAAAPFDIGDGQRLERTCSVGFAGLPFHPEAPGVGSWTDIVELADQALYMAKQAGRNRWFGVAAGREAPSRAQFDALKSDIQGALRRGELRLLSGPHVSTETSDDHRREIA